MQDFVFSNKTKIYFGKNQLHHLGEEVSRFGKKVLLVYGGGSIKKIGLYDKVIAELNKAGTEVFELPGVEPNPRHTTVNKGAAICKKENIDVLLAVGGGSTIDCTKAIAATAKYDGDDCWDLVTRKGWVIQIRLPVGGNTSLSACHTSSRLFKDIIHLFVEKSSAAGNISIKKGFIQISRHRTIEK